MFLLTLGVLFGFFFFVQGLFLPCVLFGVEGSVFFYNEINIILYDRILYYHVFAFGFLMFMVYRYLHQFPVAVMSGANKYDLPMHDLAITFS